MIDFKRPVAEEKLREYMKKHSLDQDSWNQISVYQTLSEEFIRDFQNEIYWPIISRYQKLSEDLIRELQAKVSWRSISSYQTLSEDFIREFQDKVHWRMISKCQILSEAFIQEFQNQVDWHNVSIYQQLSETFIREFQNKVDWYMISKYQKLSEAFIREFQDRVDWHAISEYQPLSEDFIQEFQNMVNWDLISKYQKLSDAMINSKDYRIQIKLAQDNWLNKDAEFKKQAVQETGLYECHEDYFLAYKGIRRDRYSNFNFQYQYLSGQTYERFADGSWQANSFGLSVWTKEEAANYCDELVVACKVYYSDVARVTHDGGKVRCTKITILD